MFFSLLSPPLILTSSLFFFPSLSSPLSPPLFPSPAPLFFMVALGEENVFCCSQDFLSLVMNGMSSVGSKFFHITKLACFVGLFFQVN